MLASKVQILLEIWTEVHVLPIQNCKILLGSCSSCWQIWSLYDLTVLTCSKMAVDNAQIHLHCLCRVDNALIHLQCLCRVDWYVLKEHITHAKYPSCDAANLGPQVFLHQNSEEPRVFFWSLLFLCFGHRLVLESVSLLSVSQRSGLVTIQQALVIFRGACAGDHPALMLCFFFGASKASSLYTDDKLSLLSMH